jgi:hypothetical protein
MRRDPEAGLVRTGLVDVAISVVAHPRRTTMRFSPALALIFNLAATLAACAADVSSPGAADDELNIESTREALSVEMGEDITPALASTEFTSGGTVSARPLPCRTIYQWCTADCPPLPFFCALGQCDDQIEAHEQCIAACKQERSECCSAYGTTC